MPLCRGVRQQRSSRFEFGRIESRKIKFCFQQQQQQQDRGLTAEMTIKGTCALVGGCVCSSSRITPMKCDGPKNKDDAGSRIAAEHTTYAASYFASVL